jgi:hypothetical protein
MSFGWEFIALHATSFMFSKFVVMFGGSGSLNKEYFGSFWSVSHFDMPRGAKICLARNELKLVTLHSNCTISGKELLIWHAKQ